MEYSEQPTEIRNSYGLSVDYLTVTTKTDKESAILIDTLYRAIGSEFLTHSRSSAWRFMGYAGKSYEGLRYGLRGEEAIVMLSGPLCSQLWGTIAPKRGRCTRIDIQVTTYLALDKLNVAKVAFNDARSFAGAQSAFVENNHGGQTCYLGSRNSRIYARLYDKGAEQKEDPGWKWRYEVEVKKPLSEELITHLLTSKDPQNFIVNYVYTFFVSRGIIPLFPGNIVDGAIEVGGNVMSEEKSLLWLSSQVRPTIGRLIIAGREKEVRDALGLPGQTSFLKNIDKE